uniref:Energy-coupling factor transporter transmembrane protein EcfT n=1 Tax=Anaerolinea thermolimosa TaxID=229919 RepID=A0A7C4PG63_9CHLR
MLVSFSYRPRHSFIERFDPRARWIMSLALLFSIVLFWDIRFLSFFFLLSISQVFLARLTWQETRRAWLFILVLSTMMILVNTIITGGGTIGGVISGGETLFQFQIKIPLTGWIIHYVLTRERVWFALAQFLRIISIGSLFLVIPFTMDPRKYGVTFRGIGLPDKLAFTMDLAFRFIPTLARDFQITLDAQRARGYEVEKIEGNLFTRIRRMAPLFVPVTMNAILAGEDITNAMDLRCFGLKKRTWVESLKYQGMDYVMIGVSVVILVGSLLLRFVFNKGDFWFPV